MVQLIEQVQRSEKDRLIELTELEQLFDRLFPICRSITGEGLRESLMLIKEHAIDNLELLSLPTGQKVLNWEVPPEWNIHEAWIKGPSGEKIIDFRNNNLHVVNYSIPVHKKMSLEELKQHLYASPNLPEAIPYVTSYYKERWGFCLTQKQLESLPKGEYEVYINSKLSKGQLDFAHAILPGESRQEILISSYLCHPSMANNELSGPLVASFLYQRLKKWKQRRFSYRFVFVPETIGSISYLSLFGEELKKSVHSGLVLTCLGGDMQISLKKARQDDAPINQIIEHLNNFAELKVLVRSFTPTFGSDERQYCSPGFNLPVGQMARLVYGKYPEYHTSLDNKELMTITALQKSIDEIEAVLLAQELEGYYVNQYPYGEIKLDKHGLYPDVNVKGTGEKVSKRDQLSDILMVLNFADGEHTLSEIAEKRKKSVLELSETVQLLKEKGLLKGPFTDKQQLPKGWI